jgi:hypothetical protein
MDQARDAGTRADRGLSGDRRVPQAGRPARSSAVKPLYSSFSSPAARSSLSARLQRGRETPARLATSSWDTSICSCPCGYSQGWNSPQHAFVDLLDQKMIEGEFALVEPLEGVTRHDGHHAGLERNHIGWPDKVPSPNQLPGDKPPKVMKWPSAVVIDQLRCSRRIRGTTPLYRPTELPMARRPLLASEWCKSIE